MESSPGNLAKNSGEIEELNLDDGEVGVDGGPVEAEEGEELPDPSCPVQQSSPSTMWTTHPTGVGVDGVSL